MSARYDAADVNDPDPGLWRRMFAASLPLKRMLERHRFDRADGRARLDAMVGTTVTTRIDDDEPDAPCTCACRIKREGGKLVTTDDCECYRTTGVRDTPDGPRVITEPCTPTAHADADCGSESFPILGAQRCAPRIDASDTITGIVAKSGFIWSRGPVKSWRLDSNDTVPVLLDHNDPESLAVGRAHVHVDAAGDLRATITLLGDRRSKLAGADVRGGRLIGLSPRLTHFKDGTADLVHITLTDDPRNPLHLIDKPEGIENMNIDAKKRAAGATANTIPGGGGSKELDGHEQAHTEGVSVERAKRKRTRTALRNAWRIRLGDASITRGDIKGVIEARGGDDTFKGVDGDGMTSMIRAARSKRAANRAAALSTRTDASTSIDELRARRDALSYTYGRDVVPVTDVRVDASDDETEATITQVRRDRDARAAAMGR